VEGVNAHSAPVGRRTVRRAHGFTMLELLAAITIVGLVLAVSVPASARLYQSMQYREAVRDVVTLFASARYQAVSKGRFQDVIINPRLKELRLNDTVKQLPSELNVLVHSARELNDRDAGVIRFYPEGGSSGGGVDIEVPDKWGVRVNVDWLIGRVSQEKYALD
jgi:general secretion pathway protein H